MTATTKSMLYGAVMGVLTATGLHLALRDPAPIEVVCDAGCAAVPVDQVPQPQSTATGTQMTMIAGQPTAVWSTKPEKPRRTTLDDVRRDWGIEGPLDCRVSSPP